MLAGLFAEGETKITEKTITRDHTERMFMEYGLPIEIKPSGQSRTICVNKASRFIPRI